MSDKWYYRTLLNYKKKRLDSLEGGGTRRFFCAQKLFRFFLARKLPLCYNSGV